MTQCLKEDVLYSWKFLQISRIGTIRENINRENFNPGIPGVCNWDRTIIIVRRGAGPGCGRYHENINHEDLKTANPRKF